MPERRIDLIFQSLESLSAKKILLMAIDKSLVYCTAGIIE